MALTSPKAQQVRFDPSNGISSTNVQSAIEEIDSSTNQEILNEINKKQDKLISGTNIKTINGNSLLGGGNIEIQAQVDRLPYVAIDGPKSLYPTQSIEYQITNYSAFSEYSVQTTGGTATIVQDKIRLTAPSFAQSLILTITVDDNQTSFPITIRAGGVVTPTNISPINGASNIRAAATLQASAFQTLGATDTHVASRWVVTLNGAEVHDSGWNTTQLTSYNIPVGVLQAALSYQWSVQYRGTTLGDSIISTPTSFQTATTFGGLIGVAGTLGFGVGMYPSLLPPGMSELTGTNDPTSDNYGNYRYSDGSFMVFVPKFYYRIGSNQSSNYSKYGLNAIDIAGIDVFPSEAEANQYGYALHRAFIDGGSAKSGFFIDKYLAASEGTEVISKPGLPMVLYKSNTGASYSNQSVTKTGCTGIYADAITIARARGPDIFNVASIFMYDALAKLSLAHGQSSTSTTYCAWYDPIGTTNYPKGCNAAFQDVDDATVQYQTIDATYRIFPMTGFSSNLAKTTHNGQTSGVADLNGLLDQVVLGVTYPATSGTSNVSSTGFTPAFVLKPTARLATLTSGFGGSTDAWGTTSSLANNYQAIGALFDAVTTSRLGNGSSQVFDPSLTGTGYIRTCCGIPSSGGYSVNGTNQFGLDVYNSPAVGNAFPTAGGGIHGSIAGIFYRDYSSTRFASDPNTGFRAAAYWL